MFKYCTQHVQCIQRAYPIAPMLEKANQHDGHDNNQHQNNGDIPQSCGQNDPSIRTAILREWSIDPRATEAHKQVLCNARQKEVGGRKRRGGQWERESNYDQSNRIQRRKEVKMKKRAS